MRASAIATAVLLLSLAACEEPGVEVYQEDGAVPAGAIPAAPDARPDDAVDDAAAAAGTNGDTAVVAAPPVSAIDTAGGPGSGGRIQPR